MTRRRLARAAVLLLCALLLLLTWWRSAITSRPSDGVITFTSMRAGAGSSLADGLVLEGVWQIKSGSEEFGGYSALMAEPGGNLVAVSDGGSRMDFSDPSKRRPRVALSWLSDGPEIGKEGRDAESLASDGLGRFWVGYEGRNAIVRFNPGKGKPKKVRPKAMKQWGDNSGAEAMARLPDGRFLVIAEMLPANPADGCPALLFKGDPVKGAKPVPFHFLPPRGYFASDMAALPDGRVIILARRLVFPFPPVFAAHLLVADPKDIRPGRPWPWRRLASIESPVPLDNYEGIAVAPRTDGSLTLWLISDDNEMVTQRTLLLKLHWDWKPPTAKGARIAPRAL